ncbi:hypothetical protein BX265_8446 [Streptomyces sp. TLI_235]|nr:hypothetical protein [Streptomyces sp. TLI_235]PBC66231.1 hypothetical protein BX265_8446 [Streptomyces sp. TLI_235]
MLTPTETRNILTALEQRYGGEYAPAKYGYAATDEASYTEGFRLIEKFLDPGTHGAGAGGPQADEYDMDVS